MSRSAWNSCASSPPADPVFPPSGSFSEDGSLWRESAHLCIGGVHIAAQYQRPTTEEERRANTRPPPDPEPRGVIAIVAAVPDPPPVEPAPSKRGLLEIN